MGIKPRIPCTSKGAAFGRIFKWSYWTIVKMRIQNISFATLAECRIFQWKYLNIVKTYVQAFAFDCIAGAQRAPVHVLGFRVSAFARVSGRHPVFPPTDTSRAGRSPSFSHRQRVGALIPYRSSTPDGHTTAVPCRGPILFGLTAIAPPSHVLKCDVR
jgi:hypothetical protein